MKKIYTILFLIFVAVSVSKAQPVLWSQGFENNDSTFLPGGWVSYNNSSADTIDPQWNWCIRPVGTNIPGLATALSVVHSGNQSIAVSWWTGVASGISDAWLVAPKLTNVPGDAYFAFWITGGSPSFSDSCSIWISHDSTPEGFLADPANEYQNILFPIGSIYGNFEQYFVDLAAYAGQTIYIGFRYNMNSQVNGYAVQLDDVDYAGTVGIRPIGTNVPDKFSLGQNYPNPFNPTTKINFDLAKSSNVKLTVFNSLGQIVLNLLDGYKTAGSYQADFNGNALSSGTYYYRLETDNFTQTKKMQLIK